MSKLYETLEICDIELDMEIEDIKNVFLNNNKLNNLYLLEDHNDCNDIIENIILDITKKHIDKNGVINLENRIIAFGIIELSTISCIPLKYENVENISPSLSIITYLEDGDDNIMNYFTDISFDEYKYIISCVVYCRNILKK